MAEKPFIVAPKTLLRTSRENATTKIEKQLSEANVLLKKANTLSNFIESEREYKEWYDVTKRLLGNLFTDDSESSGFANTFSLNFTMRKVNYFDRPLPHQNILVNEDQQNLQNNIQNGINYLSALLKSIEYIDEEEKINKNFERTEAKSHTPAPNIVINNNNQQHGTFFNTNSNTVNQAVTSVIRGDFNSLANHLSREGVSSQEIQELNEAIEADSQQPMPAKNFGSKVTEWIGRMTIKAFNSIWQIGIEKAVALLITAICAYFGLEML